jgi:hypothetical protein
LKSVFAKITRAKSFKGGGRLNKGLPDGFFSDPKYQFGYIFEDLGIEKVAIHIFWSFVILRP